MILNQIELQKIRKIIMEQDIYYNKLINYADFAVDPQIKQIFNQTAKDSLLTKEKLVEFLNG